jgi:predicted transcriptional regulator YdeE
MNELGQPVYIVGISAMTSNDVGANEIAKLWQDFFTAPIKEKLANIASASVFSVYSDYENGCKGKYKITIGYAVSDLNNIPHGLTAVTIPAGSYQTYKAKSRNPEDIVAVWQTIWATAADLLPRNFAADFEEYKEDEVMIHIGYKTVGNSS